MKLSGLKRRVERLAPEIKEPIIIKITRSFIEKVGQDGKPVIKGSETKIVTLKCRN